MKSLHIAEFKAIGWALVATTSPWLWLSIVAGVLAAICCISAAVRAFLEGYRG